MSNDDTFYDGVIIEKRKDTINGYKSFFENAADGLFRSSIEGKFILVNQSMADLWGCSCPIEMIESITDIQSQCYFHPEDRQKLIGLILQNGFVRDYDFLAKKQDGSTFWCQMSTIVVLDDNGNIKYFEGSNRDISNRISKEEELRTHKIQLEMQNIELQQSHELLEKSQSRYFDLYDLAPVGYCTLNNRGVILESNLTAAMMLGVDRKILVNKQMSYYICKEFQDMYHLHSRELFKTGLPQTCEIRMVSKKRDPFWVQLEATLSDTGDCRFVMIDISSKMEEHDRRIVAEQKIQDIYEEARIRLDLLDNKAEESMLKFNNSILKSIQTMKERRMERA